MFIALLSLIIIMLLVGMSIGIYLLNGFGLMEMAQRKGEKYPFLGFIPYASSYLQGNIAYNNKNGGLFFLISQIVYLFLVNIASSLLSLFRNTFEDPNIIFIILMLIIGLVSLAEIIIVYVTYFRIFRKYSDHYVLMLIATILTFGLTAPIFIFAIRKNKILRD